MAVRESVDYLSTTILLLELKSGLEPGTKRARRHAVPQEHWEAKAAGVTFLCYSCEMNTTEIKITKPMSQDEF